MAVVCHTSYHRSITLDEASARAIAAQTHLFGFKPDVVPYGGAWHLSLCSTGDDAALLAALERRVSDLGQKIASDPSPSQDLVAQRDAAAQSLRAAS